MYGNQLKAYAWLKHHLESLHEQCAEIDLPAEQVDRLRAYILEGWQHFASDVGLTQKISIIDTLLQERALTRDEASKRIQALMREDWDTQRALIIDSEIGGASMLVDQSRNEPIWSVKEFAGNPVVQCGPISGNTSQGFIVQDAPAHSGSVRSMETDEQEPRPVIVCPADGITMTESVEGENQDVHMNVQDKVVYLDKQPSFGEVYSHGPIAGDDFTVDALGAGANHIPVSGSMQQLRISLSNKPRHRGDPTAKELMWLAPLMNNRHLEHLKSIHGIMRIIKTMCRISQIGNVAFSRISTVLCKCGVRIFHSYAPKLWLATLHVYLHCKDLSKELQVPDDRMAMLPKGLKNPSLGNGRRITMELDKWLENEQMVKKDRNVLLDVGKKLLGEYEELYGEVEEL